MNTKYTIIYNPLAGNKTAKKEVYKLDELLPNDDLHYLEMQPDFNYQEFFQNIKSDECVVVCGGDGTLNTLINSVDESVFNKQIYYYPLGSGNDFNRDIFGDEYKHLLRVNDYLKNLPIVCVKGIRRKFINGIGYGLDGYCCEVGDKKRKKSNKPINYVKISIIGTLFKYKRTNAKVTVDGNVYNYKDVWVASTMKGRFYGGGIMATPFQDRNNPNREVSVYVFRGKFRISSLFILSKSFKGEQIAYENNYFVHTGKNILIEFDKPRALQIDGETISDVYSYSVQA